MIASSATAGQPVSPSRADTTPSLHLGTDGQPRLLGVLGDHPVEGLDVLEGPAHQQRIGDAVAVVGEDPDVGRGCGHGTQFGQLLALSADGDRADGVHVDQSGLRRRAGKPARPRRRCRRSGRCWASRRPPCSHPELLPRRSGGHRLRVLPAGLAQVGVQVDQSGQHDQAGTVDRAASDCGRMRAAAGPTAAMIPSASSRSSRLLTVRRGADDQHCLASAGVSFRRVAPVGRARGVLVRRPPGSPDSSRYSTAIRTARR